MSKGKSNRVKKKILAKKHHFFLNPYKDCAFTRCPKCDAKTRVRKFPLVIHLEPKGLFLLNKSCKYCPDCDLIIAKKQEVESLIAIGREQVNVEERVPEYLVLGTLEKADWRASHQGSLAPAEVAKRVSLFKDVWNFEVIPAGWYPADRQ
jgi:hypothetical protein